MANQNPERTTPVLNYASPVPCNPKPIRGVILIGIALLLAALGVAGLWAAVAMSISMFSRRDNTALVDVFAFLAWGAGCSIIGVRRFRGALRLIRGS